MTTLNLTASDRVLLHLRDHAHHAHDREYPAAMAQKGIAEATGLRLTHVPRTLKSLEKKGFVESEKGHVKGEKRRYNVYCLTEQGLAEAARVLDHLKANDEIKKLVIACRGPVLPDLLELAGESVPKPKGACKVCGPIPNTEGFVNREAELGELNRMLEHPDIRLMVIYGGQGYGTSTLAAKFAELSNKSWNIVWVRSRNELSGFLKTLNETATEALPDFDMNVRTSKKLAEQFDGTGTLLVMDGYFEASDEMVEFLAGFVSVIKGVDKFKLLVTARENTPSYNRFYTIMDLHDGTVGEVHIRGLDMEHCRTLLGTPDIDPEALKRLHMFTMGKPETLKLLARGVEKELREKTKFKPEEIKLMLFLKEQKKSDIE